MYFKYPKKFDFSPNTLYPLHYMKWYLDQKEITEDNRIHRTTMRVSPWNKNKSYLNGDKVTYNGKTYIAKWWTQGDIPDAKVNNPWETPWQLLDGSGETPGTPDQPDTPDTPGTPPPNNNKVVYPDYSSVDVGKGIIWPNKVFAPFIDATAWPPFAFADNASKLNVPYFNLGFVVSKSADVCEPSWGTYYDADKGPLNAQIKSIRSMGGDVLVSFGGAANVPLHVTAPDENILKKQYKDFVTAYGLTRIDFDIEGSWVTDSVSLRRNSKALKLLKKDMPKLEIWFTLPVLPSGLTADGVNVINIALQEGVDIRGVNVMTMDYGDSAAPNPKGKMGQYGIDAITALHAQLTSSYKSNNIPKSSGEIWNMIGTTPMIGMNDVTTEIFTLDDARQTLQFGKNKSIGMISMWSLNRDKQCSGGSSNYVSISCSSILQKEYEFSSIFNGFNDLSSFNPGSGTPPTPTPDPDTPDTPDTPGGSKGTWNSSTAYTAGDKVTYKGSTYEAKWWTQGDAPDKSVQYHWETPWKKL